MSSLSLKNEVWRAVIRAIEAAIPDYDPVNEKVSLGRAQKTRVYAAERLKLGNGMLLLDAGIGPGTMTELLLQRTCGITVVGLDASSRLLSAAGDRLEGSYGDRLHLVRGAFEALPFRESSFQRIVSSYAFRDARDRTRAIDEFCRVVAGDGLFGIVDLGKPNNSLKRSFIGFYVRYLIPLIAKFSMSKVTTGNPWQMIYPTYRALGNNGELVAALNRRFHDIRITEFALGGVIFVLAGKSRFIV